MKLSRWLPLAIFLALALLLAAGVWMSRQPDRDVLPSTLIGKPAPDFALPSLHEPRRTVTLRQLRGQPFVLNVWGSWCPTCRDEHPVLTRFADTRRVRVIGIDWKDERADALRWLERFGNPYWLVLADPEGRTVIDFGVAAAPETFLVDADGVVRWKKSGALTDDDIANGLVPALDQLEGRR
ncbi:DsbE family thiol:disulfide interchange protein [Pseudoluteimonas lycopersici]|uniref:DsbE family thiol:disulfide interchange protein n=1 Tax=Pseudoluteimonas lycopersici TaxID=1324796 RepID=A0A516V2M3_9GAMM|nr:DsbE family thiol:disulfide interchange protein [Lysobacter lycopersici]QDQ72763.1 DsbE family thiol:disulfide interchange protein [Lysobacter lycopersici]